MRWCVVAVVVACALRAGALSDHEAVFAVQLADADARTDTDLDAAAARLAVELEATVVRRVGQLRGVYLLRNEVADTRLRRGLDAAPDLDAVHARAVAQAQAQAAVVWAAVQTPLARSKRRDTDVAAVAAEFGLADPAFLQQWHLVDAGGHDVNVTGVWREGVRGKGVTVAMVDDGLDYRHPDFSGTYCAECSWDYNLNRAEPLPMLVDDVHGTRCAGQIAAAPNTACGVGVAHGARVSGLRILSGAVTDSMEADALNYRWNDNHVYSNSWGPYDNGQTVEAPGPLLSKALVQGVMQGRQGRGSVYVFASGNGGLTDNCNFDGYTNSPYTIAIGALGRDGLTPWYQEPCAAQLAVTYTSNAAVQITTTDIKNGCTNKHGGTSAAAPLAAGMIALALSVRPELSWRDVQWLVVNTSLVVLPTSAGWQVNAAGYAHHEQLGFGVLDAWRLVDAARTWPMVGPQVRVEMPWQHVGRGIPYGAAGLSTTYTVTDADVGSLAVLEHVQAVVTLTHAQRGDLVIDLVSPSGCTSRLATRRSGDRATTGLSGWAFDTVRCWGESAVGVWTLIVRDEFNEAKTGALTAWRLVLYGTDAVPGAGGPASPERGSPAPPTVAAPTAAGGDASAWQRQVLVPVLLVVAGATVVVAVLVAVVGRVRQRRRGAMGHDRVVFVPLSTVSTGTDDAAAEPDT